MVARNFVLLFLMGALSRVAVAQSSLDLLAKYYNSRGKVRCEMVQNYRVDASSMRIKFVSDGEGRMMWHVIQPLAQEGQMTLIDNDYVYMFQKDKMCATRVLSPLKGRMPVKGIEQLIRRNYRLSAAQPTSVSGRPAFKVIAYPNTTGLPTRTFWIDRTMYVLLRAEAEVNGQHIGWTVDTISARELEDVEITNPAEEEEGWSVEKQWGPRLVSSMGTWVQDRLGFRAWAPAQIDNGFDLESIFLNGDSKSPYLELRYTDGLSTCTLMIAKKSHKSPIFASKRTVIPAQGELKGVYETELPESVGTKLINSYFRRKP